MVLHDQGGLTTYSFDRKLRVKLGGVIVGSSNFLGYPFSAYCKHRTIIYYIIIKGINSSVSCESLPTSWKEIITETQFPLPPGSEVSLKCSPGHTLTGDSTVTCVQGTDFSFINTPFCELGTMVITLNYLNFNYVLKKKSAGLLFCKSIHFITNFTLLLYRRM